MILGQVSIFLRKQFIHASYEIHMNTHKQILIDIFGVRFEKIQTLAESWICVFFQNIFIMGLRVGVILSLYVWFILTEIEFGRVWS